MSGISQPHLPDKLIIVLHILITVKNVTIYFGTDQEEDLTHVSLDELKTYFKQGHFSAGSMGPKVEAVIQFIESAGKQTITTHYDYVYEAARLGQTGTHVIR